MKNLNRENKKLTKKKLYIQTTSQTHRTATTHIIITYKENPAIEKKIPPNINYYSNEADFWLIRPVASVILRKK